MSATFHQWRRALESNSTASDFTDKVATLTKPAGAGVFDLFSDSVRLAAGSHGPKYLHLLPFGTDGEDEIFALRVWGWSREVEISGLWLPQLLLELTVTLGDCDGEAIGTDHLLADTLELVAGDTAAPLISPENDTPASGLVHLRGVQLVEFDFNLDTAAAANCFWRTLDQD